ncbi:glutamine synthetase family protein [Microbaculum marinisediminis]|uniref:Glutamine synthetase family protein n=1 Tax=Microbaculum marinisediminis TaxID=2931392 RepID=A0AAW5QXS6_9HYPH|nr:glutamine synthetase family protein [Microbaculum sp. A6E488]MCT8972780.1 glutamine synthetase family protein [Microbaculum sp. A6E488]
MDSDPSETPKTKDDIVRWLRGRNIDEVECLVPDMTGMMRGKIVPREDFIRNLDSGLRLPETILLQAVTGDPAEEGGIQSETDQDIRTIPDVGTVRIVPWYQEPTAQVICDTTYNDGTLVDFAPRSVLKRVLQLYADQGLTPIVAPELEYYLVEKSTDPDIPLTTPVGISGRKESGRQAYGIEAANEFDPVVEEIYAYCEESRIEIGTMAHEAGPAQLEMNFLHGDPLELADQVFLFKRAARKAALKHDMYATFMAMPHENEPGSAMHVHQSIVRADNGRNIFVDDDGNDAPTLFHYISGLQRYVPSAMPLFCPNVNSFRRIRLESDAPINVHWGRDNRTCGLRVPDSPPSARRVENRVPGVDSNPYIAFAATLACGLLGLRETIDPDPVVTIDAHTLPFGLPLHHHDALVMLSASEALREVLGSRFVDAFLEVKRLEWQLYNRVISSWEREYLLLNV